ncbi:MAG TPA: hypothetical protein VF787_20160 [Thermoanaerobaculia bacterium]
MKTALQIPFGLLLTACLTASGADKRTVSPEPPPPASVETSTSTSLYANTLRIISLADGTHFVVVQRNGYAAEPHAMIGYTIDAKTHEVLRPFKLSAGLGPGVAREGTVGQVFGAALSADQKHLAYSGSYLDASGTVKSAIVVREGRARGNWRPVRVIHDITGAGDIAFTSNGSILAVEFDPRRSANGSPLLVLFDSSGARVAEFFAQEEGLDSLEGARRSVRARIQALGHDRFAFHDGVSPHVEIFKLSGRDLTENKSIAASALANDEMVDRVRGWRVEASGALSVVRLPAAHEGAPRAYQLVTIAPDGTVLRDDSVPPSFTKIFWENDDLWGIGGDATDLTMRYVAGAATR